MRIDAHIHLLPDDYRAELSRQASVPYALPPWSLDLTNELMDRHGIDAAILSLAPPGVWFGDAGGASELDQTTGHGGELSLDQRVAVRLAATHAIHLATRAVDLSYHLAGSSAILTANPFERRFRDIHAVTQQVQGRHAHYENVGRFLFGLEVGETWL